MRMLFMIALAILPALVIGEEEKTAAAANFQAVCDFYAQEIKKLEENKKELKDLVKWESVLYEKLNSSSGICNAIGYLALPECAIKNEGVNVFDKLDDKCAEDKTNKITKSLKTVLGLGTEPSGEVVFRSCKDIFVKIILEQFKKMEGLISSQCDQSMSTSPARRKRSYGGGYYHGGYDPSTIWFQYLLCHEQKISCYFFTQGWNEKEFGQYYLYENVLDTDLHSLGHTSLDTEDHLLTLLLLAGAGSSHQYPHQGYPSYKKRRDAGVEEKDAEDDTVKRVVSRSTEGPKSKTSTLGRRRRRTEDNEEYKIETSISTLGRRRRSTEATEEPKSKASTSTLGRRRRSPKATKEPKSKSSTSTLGRRRRSTEATEKPKSKASTSTLGRRRRSTEATKEPKSSTSTLGRRRRSTDATGEPKSKASTSTLGRRRRNTGTIKCVSDDGSCDD